ncbi:Ribonuclease H domain [Macleaya cordata]|uniref:Ribonuclease H domain n=1 Tax=Macleaya cordata TaxID=56857 RepID=A0A200QKA8_MACCD|nr:Ribonuclease H domain [Macleaya cordata]
MHGRLATDDSLRQAAIIVTSCCSLCNVLSTMESTNHLFFECQYAVSLWNWIGYMFNIRMNHDNMDDILSTASRMFVCAQVKYLCWAAIISGFWTIWWNRNKVRFEDEWVSIPQAIKFLTQLTSESGNLSNNNMSNSVVDLSTLRYFGVKARPRKAPRIDNVCWYPPLNGWIQINSDGCSLGNLGMAGSGGILCDSHSRLVGCLSISLDIKTSIFAEFHVALCALEITLDQGWDKIWLECDSLLVVMAFEGKFNVLWKLQNRWSNCVVRLLKVNFRFSHIFHEGNQYADILSKRCAAQQGFFWWATTPDFLPVAVGRDLLGLPYFRFK